MQIRVWFSEDKRRQERLELIQAYARYFNISLSEAVHECMKYGERKLKRMMEGKR